MPRYIVELHSQAGMWTYYDGFVEVEADDDNHAIERALDRLKKESFPDRPRNSWVIDEVRRKGR